MKLSEIQAKLKAPKNQYSSYGDYHYRSCEDIVEALKLIINPAGISLIMSDKMIDICGNPYVESTAELIDDSGKTIGCATANARETIERKKFDSSQLTGCASSYSRKYALNGLLAIDDTKDADAVNDTVKAQEQNTKRDFAVEIKQCKSLQELAAIWNDIPNKADFQDMKDARKAEFEAAS